MRKYDGLFEEVVSFSNLYAAAGKARQGCTNTLESCRFFFHLETELLNIRDELTSMTYIPGAYRFFFVNDPKKRRIAVAPFRDRVVHHAIVNVLSPIYERSYIYDSYATRPGKGTHQAVLRAQSFVRRWPWYLKADVHKYFDSVDHEILRKIIARKIRDQRLLRLLNKIIANAPEPGRGLPIGNLTSQFLANVYLDPFDHMVKEELRIKGYLRYMDDFILFSHSRQELKTVLGAIINNLGDKLLLQLKPSGIWINRSALGLSFLGMRIYPALLRVRKENLKRCKKRMLNKISIWRQGRISEESMRDSLVSSTGHLKKFCPALSVNL